jgi:acetyl-CoA carboxylase biotin carboxyl carrier protein
METKEIQKLIEFINQSGLAEVDVETSDIKLSIKRFSAGTVSQQVMLQAQPVVQQSTPAAVSPAPVAPVASTPVPTPATPSTNTIAVKSPMIGTFYSRAKPDSPSFVNVGDEIKVGQVLCIIEAMKLFNEIESEVAGRVVKVLADDKTPVEFDQTLFLVEPI